MNKLTEKVVPIMNDKEMETLILSHYECESQTLTSGAEAHLLQFNMANGFVYKEGTLLGQEIIRIYRQNKTLSGDRLAQLVKERDAFSGGLTRELGWVGKRDKRRQ